MKIPEMIMIAMQIEVLQDDRRLMAGEACHLSYHGSISLAHRPLTPRVTPDTPLMTGATGFEDRKRINRRPLYRYIISCEPHNFKGHLDGFPLTVVYGRAMDTLRREPKA